jgi:hypothetical protein
MATTSPTLTTSPTRDPTTGDIPESYYQGYAEPYYQRPYVSRYVRPYYRADYGRW